MGTKDVLAEALRKVGLTDMADRAAEGLYHDFLSPLPDPAMQLAADLAAEAAKGTPGAAELRQRHLNGDFDANTAESEEWWENEGRALLEGEFDDGAE